MNADVLEAEQAVETPITPGQAEKLALLEAEQQILSSDNSVIQKLIALDRQLFEGVPFAELLTRLTVVESQRSRDSLLRAIGDRLLAFELNASNCLKFCQELRADGYLPEALQEMPAVEHALDQARDW